MCFLLHLFDYFSMFSNPYQIHIGDKKYESLIFVVKYKDPATGEDKLTRLRVVFLGGRRVYFDDFSTRPSDWDLSDAEYF